MPREAPGAGVDAVLPAADPEVEGPGPGVVAGVAGTCTGTGGSGIVTDGRLGAPGICGSPEESASFCGSTVRPPAGAAVANAQTVSNEASVQARARPKRLDTVATAVCPRAVSMLAQPHQRSLRAPDEVNLVHQAGHEDEPAPLLGHRRSVGDGGDERA